MAYKLLVVDDDRDITNLLEKRLKREGFEVAVAFDGEEALRQVGKEDPDIILLDLMMPKLNGFEVLKEVREKHNNRWRPVIIISAKNELDSVKSCYSMEADQYLVKPITIEKVLEGIQTMISLIPLRRND